MTRIASALLLALLAVLIVLSARPAPEASGAIVGSPPEHAAVGEPQDGF